MRRAAIASVTGVAFALLTLTGCSESAGAPNLPNAPANVDPAALQTKIKALRADECYTDEPTGVYPHCAKFITQLASTVGTVDQQLAGKSQANAVAARDLRSGVDTYQQLSCDQVAGSPSDDQRRGCPRALKEIHVSLDTLAG